MVTEISEIIKEHKNKTKNYLTNTKRNKVIINDPHAINSNEYSYKKINKPKDKDYQKIYTLKKAIEKKYLPSNATIEDINKELIERLIQGGDFCIYNKDGSVDMYFDAPKYETKNKIKNQYNK